MKKFKNRYRFACLQRRKDPAKNNWRNSRKIMPRWNYFSWWIKSNDVPWKLSQKKIILQVFVHKNTWLWRKSKTCYEQAIKAGADIVVMVHPDYQYAPALVAPLVEMIKTGKYGLCLGFRILSGDSIQNGMPMYKYISNRFLTLVENILPGQNYQKHTGLRAYSKITLFPITWDNSNDLSLTIRCFFKVMAKGFKLEKLAVQQDILVEAHRLISQEAITYGFGCLYWGFLFFLRSM